VEKKEGVVRKEGEEKLIKVLPPPLHMPLAFNILRYEKNKA
jgi:hypothetical protein